MQFTATGTYKDGSTADISSLVTWISDKPSIVAIDSHGLATAKAAGRAIITATLSGIYSPPNVSMIVVP